MFDTIWRAIVWADALLDENALPAILAFMASASITSFLKYVFGAL